MVFDGIVIALIVGFLRKGNLKGIATLKLKWGWIFPVLLLFQMLIFSLQNKIELLGSVSGFLYIFVYIVGLVFLVLNRNHPGFILILIGVFLNFLVMAVNGGRMPVSPEAALVLDPAYLEVLSQELYAKHTLLSESTRLGIFGDIIPITDPYPRTQVISIGDIIMNVGIFQFIQYLMLHYRNENNREDTSLPLKGGETN